MSKLPYMELIHLLHPVVNEVENCNCVLESFILEETNANCT